MSDKDFHFQIKNSGVNFSKKRIVAIKFEFCRFLVYNKEVYQTVGFDSISNKVFMR